MIHIAALHQSEVHLAGFTICAAEAPLSGGNETPLLFNDDMKIEPGALTETNFSEDSVGRQNVQKIGFRPVCSVPNLILSA